LAIPDLAVCYIDCPFKTFPEGEEDMLHIIDTNKTVDVAAKDLEEAVKRNSFGVLHIYDLKAKLKEKGVDFPNECRILEICNPKQAARVLNEDMSASLALPCRVSVYQENGQTKIGTIKPTALLAMFPNLSGATTIAHEVEEAILKMMDEAS